MSDPHDDRTGGDPGDRPTGEGADVGSVAEEATKLFGALADWARQQQPEAAAGVAGLGAQVGRAAQAVEDHLATGAPECTWCPVCRSVHALRTVSPEVRAHLATAASSLLHAAAGLLATQPPAPHPRAGDVEHIDLDDDPGDDPDAEDPR